MGTLDHRAALLLVGLLIAAALMRRENPLAFLAAIFAVTGLAWALGYATRPERLTSAPDFSSAFLALDVRGALNIALLPSILAILFTDLFDSLSTFIGVASAAGLTDPERPLDAIDNFFVRAEAVRHMIRDALDEQVSGGDGDARTLVALSAGSAWLFLLGLPAGPLSPCRLADGTSAATADKFTEATLTGDFAQARLACLCPERQTHFLRHRCRRAHHGRGRVG